MKANRRISDVSRPANLNPNVWSVMKKVANQVWDTHQQGQSWNRQILVSCKEFYNMLLDENGQLILSNSEMIRFSQNGHIKSWANELLLESINLITNQEYELAIKKLELHLSMNPKSTLALAKLADANLALCNYRVALNFVKSAIDLDSGNAAYFILRSKIYSNLDQDEKALNDLNFALLLNNRNAEGYALRGAIYLAKKESKMAMSDLKKAVNLNPAQVQYKHLLAIAYRRLNRLPESFNVLNSILKSNPFDAEALYQKALIRINFKVEEYKAEDELFLARSLGHPSAEQCLIDHFAPLGQLNINKAA